MFRFGFGGGGFGGGQIQDELAKPARLARDGNGAAITAHNAEADAQAQSRALAHFLGRKKRVENFGQVLRRDARPVVADAQPAAVALGAAGNFNGGLAAVRRFFFAQRINGVFQQVDHDENEMIAARPDRLARCQVQLQGNVFVLHFAGDETLRDVEDVGQGNLFGGLCAGMREGAEVGNDVFHALEAVLDVVEDGVGVGQQFRRQLAGFFAQDKQAGAGIVQRVEDVVHEAGAEPAERRHFFGLNELRLGFLDLAVSLVERDVLFAQFGVGGFEVVLAFVQFKLKYKFAEPLAALKISADDDDDVHERDEIKIVEDVFQLREMPLKTARPDIHRQGQQHGDDAFAQGPMQHRADGQQDQVQRGVIG